MGTVPSVGRPEITIDAIMSVFSSSFVSSSPVFGPSPEDEHPARAMPRPQQAATASMSLECKVFIGARRVHEADHRELASKATLRGARSLVLRDEPALDRSPA